MQLDPLQFVYRPNISVEDALRNMLQRTHSHLDTSNASERLTFFDFSSAFDVIQPQLLGEKMRGMQVDPSLVSWCLDYLSSRPPFVRLQNGVSDTIQSSTGAPQGTILAPFLYIIYTANFKHITAGCFHQKFSDDTVITGLIKGGEDEEYRSVIRDFADQSDKKHLYLNITKIKEMVVDFRRRIQPAPAPICILGAEVEVVSSHRYRGVRLDNKFDRWIHVETVCKKGQGRLYFLRRLRSFNISQPLL